MKKACRMIRMSLLLFAVLCSTVTVYAQQGGQSINHPEPGQMPPHPPRLPERVIPAFPGAWGAGMFTSGGRGGKVIAVTNLNDSGPGSLRAALEAEGPRIVVFRVAGTIKPESDLNINHPDITIAGQSAPGDGICIAGTLNINTYNVIVRHVRVRRGVPVGGQEMIISAEILSTISLSTTVPQAGVWMRTFHFTVICVLHSMELLKLKIPLNI